MACIGLGGRGKENLRSLMGDADCRIVAVCDSPLRPGVSVWHTAVVGPQLRFCLRAGV